MWVFCRKCLKDTWRFWGVALLPLTSGFCGWYGCMHKGVNKMLSYWDVIIMFAFVFSTLPTTIQRVGMAVSVYCIDSGNIAQRSCCDWNDTPPGCFLGGCLPRRVSSHWIYENYQVGFELCVHGNHTTRVNITIWYMIRIAAFMFVYVGNTYQSHPLMSHSTDDVITYVGGGFVS